MKEKACFFTVVSSHFRQLANACKRSVNKFYPNIPFFIILVPGKIDEDKKRVNRVISEGLKLFDKYKRVIKMDADSFMLKECPEIFGDFDLAMPLNNVKFTEMEDLGVKRYMNNGLLVCTNKNLWQEWYDKFQKSSYKYGNDQDLINLIAWSGKYKICELPLPYGIAEINWYPEMILDNDGSLFCDNKKINIVHFGGLYWKFCPLGEFTIKLSLIKNKEARERLGEIVHE